MCNRLNEVLASARAVVASLDVDSLSPAQAASGFEKFAELEKVAAAGKVLLAPKIGQSDAWARAGHRSPEEWMARRSGTTVTQAKNTVETGKRLAELPATEAAVKSGSLSLAQASAVSEGAAAAPDKEAELLEAARTETVKGLRDKSRRLVLDSLGSIEERYERQRKLRSFTSWTDDEGMTAGRFRLTPDAGASVVTAIQKEADRHFRKSHREGRHESAENYAADALVGLVTGEGLIGTKSGSRGSEVVVIVSRDSLLRGEVDSEAEERCEVPGFGAIPVSRAREMMSDSFLKGVLVDGTKVVTVRHFGRHRPAELDTALMVRTVLQQGHVCCDFDGCGRRDIEWDHTHDRGKGGPTAEDNLRPLCRFHHREKTAGRLARRNGRWQRLGAERGPP